MNRKQETSSRSQRGKVSDSEMKKKEKERRKLEQELKQVRKSFVRFLSRHPDLQCCA